MLFKCRLNMIKATFSSGFYHVLLHFVFAPKNHISFFQSCAFGFAVITWAKIYFTVGKKNNGCSPRGTAPVFI